MAGKWTLGLALLAATALAATRPHYGGVLRVQIRDAVTGPEIPSTGRLAELTPAFNNTQWDAGRRAVYSADDNAPGGRPFLDSIEIEFGRPVHEQAIALNLGKADLVQMDTNEPQRPAAGQKVWASSPVRILLLVFASRVEDARVREALALAVDRTSIHNVLLQRRGEICGALLPQWLSGYAFLFPVATDIVKARALVASVPSGARTFSLGIAEPSSRRIADRIALNARDAGLTLTPALPGAAADVRLVEVRISSLDPATALAGIAAALRLAQPAKADSPDALYAAERALLDGYRVVPLFHLPDIYAAGPRVKGGPGLTPLGEWHFENLWVEGPRP